MSKIEVTYFEDIAQEVKDIHAAMQKIKKSGLTDSAIVFLVSKISRESQTTVSNVLYGLENIDKYLKKPIKETK